MMVDTVRVVSDRVSYYDDEPMLNVVVIRQLVAENNVSCLPDSVCWSFYYLTAPVLKLLITVM